MLLGRFGAADALDAAVKQPNIAIKTNSPRTLISPSPRLRIGEGDIPASDRSQAATTVPRAGPTSGSTLRGADIACLSPDGSNIAYQDGDSIWVVNVSTGESLEVAVGRMAAWLDADTLIVAPTRSGRVSRPYNRPTWLPSGAPGLPIVDIRRVRNEIPERTTELANEPGRI
jgi:hypothetical protein